MKVKNTEMIEKEPAVKLLQKIKDNLEDMGKTALKGELNPDAVSYISALFCGKIEQYLDIIGVGQEHE